MLEFNFRAMVTIEWSECWMAPEGVARPEGKVC